jgi:hypothetical protein
LLFPICGKLWRGNRAAVSFISCSSGDPSLKRLLEVLAVPGTTFDMVLRFPAGGLAEMQVTRYLTAEELDALSEWFATEGVSPYTETATTTYSLERREKTDDGDSA